MNTSRPRTFSISSMLTSPSLKRPTNARPSEICRLRAISCASAGLALPANSASVSLVLMLSALCAISTALAPCPRASRAGLMKLAGVEGFEPPNGGIKTRCLTTWRHPSICPPAASWRARILQPPHVCRPCLSSSCTGELFRPRATKLLQRSGTRAARRSASLALPHALKTHEPVPVRCAGAKRASHSSAAAAEASAQGDALVHLEVRPEARAGGALERPGRPHGQVRLARYARRAHRPLDPPVLAHPDRDRVAQVDELKERLQLVVTVRATADDVQKEIEFRGGGPVRLRARPAERIGRRGGHNCHSSTSSRTRTASRRSVRRAGSDSPPTAT